ncbi:MAG TPA: hypothetical protein VGS20_05860 [Candidatus Acidoferrales bacterium]|nr:hypothetical protein [Candidatus Acidoferrales bacterium]
MKAVGTLMRGAFLPRLLFALMMVWLVATVALLLGAAAAALRDSSFSVVLGLIDASGLAAVLAMLLPAVCGLGAAWLVLKRRRAGPALLLLYSAFWLVSLGGGAIASVVQQGLSAAAHTPLRGWLVGGSAFGTMIAAFALMAVWSVRRLREAAGRAAS